MLSQLKPFHCPFCNSCFSSRDYGRQHGISNFPLLLKCGHSVCESCAKNSAHRHRKIVCRECQLPTDLSEGDLSVSSLLPDVYVLGVLNANMKRSLPSLKLKMPTASTVDTKRRQKQNYTPTVCNECLKREAIWNCDKCEEDLCNICFDHIHSKGIKTMQKHDKKPIDRVIYNSMIEKSCKDHSNRDLEFFCDQDNELACSHCCVTGKHKGHNVLTLRQKNKSCQDGLKSAYEAALLVKKRMRYSEKKLSDVIPTLKMDNTPEITKIRNHFRTLHAALQLREHELVEQIEEINRAKIIPLEKMCLQLREYQQSVDDLILDAERTLKDPGVVINSPALIMKLEETKNFPQHLISVAHDELCEVDTHLDEIDILPLLKSVGRISANVQETYELKSPSDLPQDHILDPIPMADVASTITETESVKSEAFSEDSLCSPLTPLTEKSTTSDITEVFKHRQSAVSHSDKVIVSHIRDPGKFWVQRCAESRKLKIMSDAINKWCRSTESSKHIPSELDITKGDLYLVQYSADGKWYRARVKQIFATNSGKKEERDSSAVRNIDDIDDLIEAYNELTKAPVMKDITLNRHKEVEVLYVDYGNTEIVPVSRLKNIQTRFLNVPGMAKECSLYDIFPVREDTWSSEAIKLFAKFVSNKEVVMMISEERNGILYVDLCQAAASDITNDVPVSVRDALVFLEHGQFTSPDGTAIVFPLKNVRQFLPSDKLPANTKCNVILSHIETPAIFYVQQVTTAGSLSNLINDMNMTYKSDVGNTLYRVYVPYIGMVCAAQYSVDKQWYRAQVLSLPGGAMVEVQYVDFGNKEVVHNRHLRKLFDRFLRLTKQAIACSLAEIKPAKEEWGPESKNWMMKMAYKKQLYLKSLGMVEGDKANVLLFEVEGDTAVCLNALMVEDGLASSCGPGLLEVRHVQDVPSSSLSPPGKTALKGTELFPKATASPKKPVVLCSTAEVTDFPQQCLMAKRNFKESSVPVVVTHIETPGLFYLQLGTKVQEDLKKMMEDIQLIYKDFESPVKEVDVGGVYAVLNEKENKWYRGTVLEVQDDFAKIFFLDYGFTQNVSIGNIHTLVDRLRLEEAFSLRCHLADIQPAGDTKQWSKVSIQAFNDIISSNAQIYFSRKDYKQEPSSSLASELYVEMLRRGGALEPSVLEYINIADLLIEKGVALPVRKKKDSAVIKSSGDGEDADISVKSCSSNSSTDCPVSSDSPSAAVPVPHKTIHLKAKPTLRWKPYEYPTATHFTAIVTYVDENGSIFLHDIEKGACKIDLIKKAMHYKYSKGDHVKLHIPPPIGQACIAKFHLDNEWYRAEVMSTKPDTVKVLFVDYGNVENVPLDDVCLDVIMADIPAQGVECQLSGIEPATPDKKWVQEILEFLHLAIVEQECIIDVDTPKPGKPVQISLRITGGIDMRDILVQMGGAVFSNNYSSPADVMLNNPLPSPEKAVRKDVPIFNTFKKASPLREGEPFQVCVTQLLEPNFVFLQQLKIDEPASDYDKMRNVELDNFLTLMKELTEKVESLPSVEKPELGVAYCAEYSYDSSWYRCEVTNVCGDEVSVLFVDYGNSEVIPVNRLRQLDDHFVDFPVQAHFCKLHHVEPIGEEDGWSSEVVTAMVDILFHSATPLYARVVNPGEVCEVELLVKSDDEEDKWELVYQKLVDENLIQLKA